MFKLLVNNVLIAFSLSDGKFTENILTMQLFYLFFVLLHP